MTVDTPAGDAEVEALRRGLEARSDYYAVHVTVAPLRRLFAHLDATTAKLSSETAAREKAERRLGDLLAIIHRDGGHYTNAHGVAKSVEDAHLVWADLTRKLEAASLATHRQANCIHQCAAYIGPDTSATIEGLPKAVRHLAEKLTVMETRIALGDAAWSPLVDESAEAVEDGADRQHWDDLAVDRFAYAMKAKLAKKRAEGLGGWDRKIPVPGLDGRGFYYECPNSLLSRLLRQHIEKGDPVDVGNFAMMIHQRGERIC